jgi:hypothetical protein
VSLVRRKKAEVSAQIKSRIALFQGHYTPPEHIRPNRVPPSQLMLRSRTSIPPRSTQVYQPLNSHRLPRRLDRIHTNVLMLPDVPTVCRMRSWRHSSPVTRGGIAPVLRGRGAPLGVSVERGVEGRETGSAAEC